MLVELFIVSPQLLKRHYGVLDLFVAVVLKDAL